MAERTEQQTGKPDLGERVDEILGAIDVACARLKNEDRSNPQQQPEVSESDVSSVPASTASISDAGLETPAQEDTLEEIDDQSVSTESDDLDSTHDLASSLTEDLDDDLGAGVRTVEAVDGPEQEDELLDVGDDLASMIDEALDEIESAMHTLDENLFDEQPDTALLDQQTDTDEIDDDDITESMSAATIDDVDEGGIPTDVSDALTDADNTDPVAVDPDAIESVTAEPVVVEPVAIKQDADMDVGESLDELIESTAHGLDAPTSENEATDEVLVDDQPTEATELEDALVAEPAESGDNIDLDVLESVEEEVAEETDFADDLAAELSAMEDEEHESAEDLVSSVSEDLTEPTDVVDLSDSDFDDLSIDDDASAVELIDESNEDDGIAPDPESEATEPEADDLEAILAEAVESADIEAEDDADEAVSNIEQLDEELAGLAESLVDGDFEDVDGDVTEIDLPEPVSETAAKSPALAPEGLGDTGATMEDAAFSDPPEEAGSVTTPSSDSGPDKVEPVPSEVESKPAKGKLLALIGAQAVAGVKKLAVAAAPAGATVLLLASKPTNKLPAGTRDTIGWLGLYTAFLSICVWGFLLLFRQPTTPAPTTDSVSLIGESASLENTIEEE